MSKKLIIWDFDGVISDTEKLWVENRRRMLNEKFGLNWDFATVTSAAEATKPKKKNLTGSALSPTTRSGKKRWTEITNCWKKA